MEKAKATRGPRAPQTLEAAAHPSALLRISVVRQITGLGTTSIYGKMAKGDFPAAIRLGARCTRWKSADVMRWVESLK